MEPMESHIACQRVTPEFLLGRHPPCAEAVIDEFGRRLTYGQLRSRAALIGAALHTLAEKGCRGFGGAGVVGIMVERCVGLVCGLLG